MKIITPFGFYCQHVIPLVYDDSLSYYEVLCKMRDKLNEVITSQNELMDCFQQLKEWVDTQLESYTKEQLNQWLTDGTLEQIINESLFNSKQNKFFVTPEDFGAKGDDITNDYEAFQKCHVYANENNLEVRAFGSYFIKPSNYFTVNGNIDFSQANIRVDLNGLQDFGWFTSYEIMTVPTVEQKTLILNGHYENYRNCIIRFTSNRIAIMRSGNTPVYEKDDLYIDDNGIAHGVMKFNYVATDTIQFVKLKKYDWKLGEISFNDDTALPSLSDWRRIGFYQYAAIDSSITGCRIKSNISTAYSVYGLLVAYLSVNESITDCLVPSLVKAPNSSSYGLRFEECFYLKLKNILNSSSNMLWDVMGSNYIYELLVENCEMSRIDCHQRLYNATIRNCILNYISVSGAGVLDINNVIFNSTASCIQLRADYGCEWNGDIKISSITINSGTSLLNISPNNVNYRSSNIIQGKNITINNVITNVPVTLLYFGSRVLADVQLYQPPLNVVVNNVNGNSVKAMFVNTYYARHANCPDINGTEVDNITTNANYVFSNCNMNLVNGDKTIDSDTQTATSWFFKSFTPMVTFENCNNIALGQNNIRTVVNVISSIISGLNLYRNNLDTFVRLFLSNSTLCYDFASTPNNLNGSIARITWNNVIIDVPKQNGIYQDQATALNNMYSNDIELKFLRNNPINTIYDCKLSNFFKSYQNNIITSQILKFTVGVTPVLNQRYGPSSARPAYLTTGGLYYDTTLNCETVYNNGYKNLIGQTV